MAGNWGAGHGTFLNILRAAKPDIDPGTAYSVTLEGAAAGAGDAGAVPLSAGNAAGVACGLLAGDSAEAGAVETARSDDARSSASRRLGVTRASRPLR